MARKAVELEAVDSIVPLCGIADEIVKALQINKTPQSRKSYAK
jgi:chemotaxis response regulator CheB